MVQNECNILCTYDTVGILPHVVQTIPHNHNLVMYKSIEPACCLFLTYTMYVSAVVDVVGLPTGCGWPLTGRSCCCHPLCADKAGTQRACPSLEELWVLHTWLCVQVSGRTQHLYIVAHTLCDQFMHYCHLQ